MSQPPLPPQPVLPLQPQSLPPKNLLNIIPPNVFKKFVCIYKSFFLGTFKIFCIIHLTQKEKKCYAKHFSFNFNMLAIHYSAIGLRFQTSLTACARVRAFMNRIPTFPESSALIEQCFFAFLRRYSKCNKGKI